MGNLTADTSQLTVDSSMTVDTLSGGQTANTTVYTVDTSQLTVDSSLTVDRTVGSSTSTSTSTGTSIPGITVDSTTATADSTLIINDSVPLAPLTVTSIAAGVLGGIGDNSVPVSVLQSGELLGTTWTDASGNWHFAIFEPPGVYTVSVEQTSLDGSSHNAVPVTVALLIDAGEPTGVPATMLQRLRANIPRNWFPDVSPVLDSLLAGPASMLQTASDLLAYVRLQTRITTATDRFLEFISADFLGDRLPRRSSEGDAAYSTRIKQEILRPRATRAALSQALTDLTGHVPVIFEPANTMDTGGYGDGNAWTGLAYGQAGGYGSLSMRYQCLVHAQRPSEQGGVPNVSGWDNPQGGYGIGSTAYSNLDQITAVVTDADIEQTIIQTIPAGTIAWLAIE